MVNKFMIQISYTVYFFCNNDVFYSMSFMVQINNAESDHIVYISLYISYSSQQSYGTYQQNNDR